MLIAAPIRIQLMHEFSISYREYRSLLRPERSRRFPRGTAFNSLRGVVLIAAAGAMGDMFYVILSTPYGE